jgi:ATP-binding cassette, subfamily B, bacterial PglK
MTARRPESRLFPQLRQLLALTGHNPIGWLVGAFVVSLVLAALDALGVAAMIPLTQLIGGAEPTSGFLAWIADLTGGSSAAQLIPIVGAGIAVVFVVKSVASLVFRWWLFGRTARVGAQASSELLRRYLLSPYAAHRTRNLSDVYWSINDGIGQATAVLMALLGILTEGTMLVGIVLVLAVVSPWVTLGTVVFFGAVVYGSQVAMRSLQSRLGEEMADASRTAWSFLMTGLAGFREARLSSSAQRFTGGFARQKHRIAEAGRQIGTLSQAPRYILEIAFVLSIIGIAVVMFATSTPTETLAVLGVFAAAALRALPSLNNVSSNVAIVRTSRAGMRGLMAAVDTLNREEQHDETPKPGAPYEGDIVVRDLSFHFPDSPQLILDRVSLRIPRERTTAFVGTSGAGKSTLLDLVLGLLEPTAGTVECGGRSIFDDLPRWYAGVGVVPQDVFLLNGTLAENIAFGEDADRADGARIAEVLELARLTEFVAGLPDGLQTVVGERGVRVSGGQRQRLGIARALYRRPSLLFLDEATSALDNETEREITATLERLGGSLTIVVIAHRLTTVRNADNIVFLKGGHVEVQGTFDELRASSADFARLAALGELR